MRARYDTEAIVLARSPLSEASALLHLLTPDFGLVRARAQGLRKSGAKLSCAAQTLAHTHALLVRGKEGWRLSGAVLIENKLAKLSEPARLRAGRIASLFLRLVHGEIHDSKLFHVFSEFLDALPTLSEKDADAAECLAALRVLSVLGLCAGDIPSGAYDSATLSTIHADRRSYIVRINHGIAASGL
ncbi:recombination protein O N-terminal domain-containing protein [Candidatus Parcubacteria bacterium]|nr:recombination protein O N-terminal domain-containing protein [Candidatus Parcubacteria bacterium]